MTHDTRTNQSHDRTRTALSNICLLLRRRDRFLLKWSKLKLKNSKVYFKLSLQRIKIFRCSLLSLVADAFFYHFAVV
jgi:hypothetical protein